jgi:hypothetical protein
VSRRACPLGPLLVSPAVTAAQRLIALLAVAALAVVAASQATAAPAESGTVAAATSSAAIFPTLTRQQVSAQAAGATIVRTNRGFSCRRPLAAIARARGGTLPLLVRIRFTRYVTINPGVIEIRRGCRGDGNPNTIDLILRVDGNGRTRGGTSDAIKVREDPHDIQITGYANCGPQGVGPDRRPDTNDDSHQDGAQIQGGRNIHFIDFRWGNWAKRRSTCQGAAGTFVPGSVNNWPVVNMACIRCRSVSCNHGMLISRSQGTVVRNSAWRSGNPNERRGRLANGQTGLCNHGSPPCIITPGQSSGNQISGQFCDRWPFGGNPRPY